MAGSASQETGIKVVLLDIEGTVCPISFVKDVLFPYALTSLEQLLATPSGWDSAAFTPYRDAFPPEHRSSPSILLSHVRDLITCDVKIAYLKNLQGWLWIRGYESGALKCPLFPDVFPAFKRWSEAGIKIEIYSSGSVPAQKLLFQYTTDGDLRPLVGGWFDTVNAGMKMEKSSYEKIAATREYAVGGWLFLSDRVEEVEAAKEAGMRSRVVVREGNVPVGATELERHEAVRGFEEFKVNGV